MKTQSNMTPEAELEALFARAQAHPPEADAAYVARVMADAQALQPGARQPRAVRRAARPGVWARFAAALGGVTAVAGLGTAAMAGLLIGYVQPEPMVTLAGSIGFGVSESLDLLPGFDDLLTEEMVQ
ncbi:MAG: hypothetical protein ACK4VZ_12245 [Paracoccaceae bacterium]